MLLPLIAYCASMLSEVTFVLGSSMSRDLSVAFVLLAIRWSDMERSSNPDFSLNESFLIFTLRESSVTVLMIRCALMLFVPKSERENFPVLAGFHRHRYLMLPLRIMSEFIFRLSGVCFVVSFEASESRMNW